MARRGGDDRTLDLLAWQPPEPQRYAEERVRTATLRDRISRAVSETLKDCEQTRADVARAMGEWLGEDVSENMLNAYASQGREEHTIPYLRLLALVQVTGDTRLLQLGAELFDTTVIENRLKPFIEIGMRFDRRNRAVAIAQEEDREIDVAIRTIRKGARQ
ncbi:DNA transposition protein [Marivibrio halodurans]|uniref:DNA transposition protein n=1 Tax=Marivibrio halodurans TaxID=2039722 RepID=A0A8J7S8A1_9PROT|nr:DNA transposition protein [Marivibrio halodurans]MBP5857257.1 DNA transposition protein [Marivibrio halodurans]